MLAVRDTRQERLIYLLRHGRIAASSERRYIGQIDIPLSDAGVRQARLLQAEFRGQDIAAVFCSDLARSLDTARIICEGLTDNLLIRADLREIAMGDWEGKPFSEIAQTYPEEYAKRGKHIDSYRIPGAESFAECRSRVIAAFSAITESTRGNVIIVGHAGANRLLLCHILGMPTENVFRISQDYGCINLLADCSGQYCINLLNSMHLPGKAGQSLKK
jgi:probable phosphoglycerate mutase